MSFDPVVSRFIKKLDQLQLKPSYDISPKEARKQLENLQKLDEVFPVTEEKISFKVPSPFEVYLIRPLSDGEKKSYCQEFFIYTEVAGF